MKVSSRRRCWPRSRARPTRSSSIWARWHPAGTASCWRSASSSPSSSRVSNSRCAGAIRRWPARSRSGGAVRRRGSAPLPRRHRLVGVLGTPGRHPADPAGRPRHLRRDSRRRHRCNHRLPPLGVPLARDPGLHGTRTALAQAIGRFGNYANQELFGGPTNLPWGLEIDPANRPAKYLEDATFHPTFLYEAIWYLIVMAILLRVAPGWRRHPPGYVLALYLALYSLGRFFVEGLRVDPAHEIGRSTRWSPPRCSRAH